MKCLILAAGYATRLYPLTENFPKPLLEVKGKTILDWLVDDIDSTGLVDGYVVVTNHRFAGVFQRWADLRNSSCAPLNAAGVRVRVVDDGTSTNETRLGAVKDISFAADSLSLDDDLLVIAGDNILDFSLKRFLEYSKAKGTSCVMRFYESDPAKLHKRGVLEIGVDDLIVGMEEKPAVPRSHWCCPPFYFLTRKDVSRVREGIQAGCGTDAPGSFIAWLCSRTPVHAMEMPGHRFDIGDLASYRAVCESYQGIIHIFAETNN